MHKMFLVALREYVENLRTKTFWIGILALPVIYALSIVVYNVMSDVKDQRSYAVIDLSEGQWLSKAIAQRQQLGDLEQLMDKVKTDAPTTELDPATLREQARAQLEELPADSPMRPWFEVILDLDDEDLGKMLQGKTPSARAIAQIVPVAVNWWRDPASQKELQRILDDLSFSRYRLLSYDAEELGDDPEGVLNAKLQSEELFAYFVIGEDPLAGSEGCRYVSNNLTDRDLRRSFGNTATDIVKERRIAKLRREKNLTKQEAELLNAPLRFSSRKVSKETGKAEEVTGTERAGQFAPIAFVYLLWIAVFVAAQMLLTNTVEEKSNRIIEVLLSSVSPLQLMSGKILGIGATGLTMVGSWALCAFLGVKLLPLFVQDFPVDLSVIITNPVYLLSFIGYFLAGYFFYAALLVGIGSVCNSLKEAQNLFQPIMVVLIVPILAMVFVVQEPNGTLARVLTYIPPFTPFLMMNRAGGPPPLWEYALTTVLIAISIVVAFWGAAKIFRIGILMTGKPPRIGEMLGWLRAPVGTVHVRRDS